MAGSQVQRRSIQSFVREAGLIVLIVISICLAGILGLMGLLLSWSPGKPAPFLDEDGHPLEGSLSEKIHIDINGAKQGMVIKSKNIRHPVLLFLHGGPGMPEYLLTQRYPTGLEEYFTLVWWEQRGAGLSYSPAMPPETMTVEQFIADTLAVTNYLRDRFGKDKIYLMGHSWGSFLGIQVAARAPELYHAYIGVSQIVYQLKSETLAYEYMLKQFKENGNRTMVRNLEQAAPTLTAPLPASYDSLRDKAMHTLGIGTTHDMRSVVTGFFLPSWHFPDYTLCEKVNLWRGKLFSKSLLWNKMLPTDLAQQVTALRLPVYFFHGIYDYTDSYPLARDYLEQLQAPVKGFYTFGQSAHSPIFEEPERTRKILQEDVLAGMNSLADAMQEAPPAAYAAR